MSPFLRKVPTASGATAVQIVDKSGGQSHIVEHFGSPHSPAELAALTGAPVTSGVPVASRARVASGVAPMVPGFCGLPSR